MTIRNWGPEQLVDTATSAFDSVHNPDIVAQPDGGFVIVWEDLSGVTSTTVSAIHMQRYDAYGNKLGGEKLFSGAVDPGVRLVPAIELLTTGDLVVAFGRGDDEFDIEGIYFQRFEADGTPIGVRVPAAAAVHPQPAVDVAAIDGGGFIITFPDGDASDENVLAVRFDAAGEQVGGIIPVATEDGVDEQSPAIATLGDGSFIAVWDDETANQIRFRLIGADGVPVGAAVAIADNPANPSGPDVLALANGGFVVTWADANQASPDTESLAVRAQMFDAAGAEVGDEFTVNTLAAGSQHSARLVAMPDGGFVAIYNSNSDILNSRIRGQIFDEFGNRVGDEFLANTTTTGSEHSPVIAALADGRLAIEWESYDPPSQLLIIRMQIIDPRDGVVTGTANGERLLGHDQVDDDLNGLGGNDVLDGLGGADLMYGGDGNDIYIVRNIGDQAIELPGQGTDLVQSSVSFALGAHVERLTLTGAAAINGTGNAAANLITGNAAANIINGGSGVDVMIGKGGNDTYFVNTAGETITELAGGGTDKVNSAVTFTLGANLENLSLIGTAAISGIGNALNNILIGNAAANILRGQGGNEPLDGAAGDDVGRGVDGDDTISGGLGNDHLFGEAGDDILNGGLGRDVLIGGLNNDIFRFNVAPVIANTDKIVDFVVVDDVIQLENAVFTGLTAGTLMATQFFKGAAAHDSDDRIIYNPTAGTLTFDTNGNAAGGATVFATIGKNLAMTGADFFVI